MTNQSFVAMGISIVVLAAVGFALLRTRIGRATRAVSDNPALAAASGIDVDKVIRLVWTVAPWRSPASPACSTRWSPTASSGTPACRSCCCSSRRSPSAASAPRSAPWSAR